LRRVTVTPTVSSEALDAIPLSPSPAVGPRVVRLFGAGSAAVDETGAVEAIVAAAERGAGHWTVTANLDHLRRYNRYPDQRALIDAAEMVVADGMPLIWASRLAGTPLPERVSRSSMIWTICEQAARRRQSIFLLGGEPTVAPRAAAEFEHRYPGLKVAGTSCPAPGFEQEFAAVERIVSEVAAARPRIVFVALGFPKRDELIRRLRQSLPSASCLGVGISLSYAAGDLSRPPDWICQVGLEWAFRLSQEPTRRLLVRYFVRGAPFSLRLAVHALRVRLRGASVKTTESVR
jgi:N-acetylglucosaminyldiphosphoundecaprenol N-acetyl-beta-D-mannosaminyltransferase